MTVADVTFRFDKFTVALHCPDEVVVRKLRAYFEAFLPAGDAHSPAMTIEAIVGEAPAIDAHMIDWGPKKKDSYADIDGARVIRKNRTGVLIELHPGRARITGNLHRNFGQLVNLLGTMFGVSLLRNGGAMLHASSAVGPDGRALAFLGHSGSAKSSVTVRLLEKGFDYLTNDRLIVQTAEGRVVAKGIPKLPRVNPGTLLAGKKTRLILEPAKLKKYESMSKGDLWHIEDKHDIDVRGMLRRSWLLSAELAAAFVLEWKLGETGTRIERLAPPDALKALLADVKTFGVFDTHQNDSLPALEVVAGAIPVFRVSGAMDPTGLAERLATYLPEASLH